MQCRRCGKDLGNSLKCTSCGYENTEGNVREMTRTERNFFDGVTIDASSENERSEENYHQQRRNNYGARGTYVSFGDSNVFTRAIGSFIRAIFNGNRLARVAAILIGVSFAALMFFVAIPLLFVTLAIGIALFALAKILR